MPSDVSKISIKRLDRLKDRGIILDWTDIGNGTYLVTLPNNVVVKFYNRQVSAFNLGAMCVYSVYENNPAVLSSMSYKGFDPGKKHNG